MSGNRSDLSAAYTSSSASSQPSTSTPSPAGPSWTRHRIANSRTTGPTTTFEMTSHGRYPDDQQLNDDTGDYYSGETPGNGGANPYAHIQDPSKTQAPWSKNRIPRHHSHSLSSKSHSDESVSPNSPFAAFLSQPRFWRLPRRGQLRYKLRSIWHSARSRPILRLLVYLVPIALIALFLLFTVYEPQIEITLYSRRWIREEVDPVLPLSGCFKRAEEEGGAYNMTERVWRKTSRWDVQAGVDMRKGMDCYDYAGMIGSQDRARQPEDDLEPLPIEERTIYHTYWRTDLVPFGPRQEYMLKSFFATQPLYKSRLILWTNGDLSSNTILYEYTRRFPEAFTIKQVDMRSLARGTALDGSDRLAQQDKRAWVDGDLLRLLVLWNMGGVWVDMDSLLTRSLEPLLEHEFVTQWDCYNKPYTPLNGALMHFHAHSPYLCEAFHIMATSSPPRSGSTDWGSLLYIKLWRRLVRAEIPPFKVLPWCFSDGRSCRIDNRLPDPFRRDGEGQGRWIPGPPRSSSASSNSESNANSAWTPSTTGGRVMGMEEGGLLDDVLHKVFSVHLHNQWEKNFPDGGWVDRLLLKRYERDLRGLLANSMSQFGRRYGKRLTKSEGEDTRVKEVQTTAEIPVDPSIER